jgi:carbamoyl-phosphate synthase large subunit
VSSPVNVLFTSAGRRVELLRAFRRAYRDLGVEGEILAVDRDPLAPALREADRTCLVPDVSDPAYLAALADICDRASVSLVFPTIDPDIPVLAAGRTRLEAAGAKVMVVSEWAARICADKILTYKLFRDLRVPVPATWTAREARAATLDFPVFVKPRSGSAGEHAVRVRDARELEFFLDYVPDPLVQTYLEGPEITSDVICGAQGEVLAVVSRRRIAVRAGEVAKGVTVAEPEILEHCVSVAKGLKAIGPITVQCLFHEGRPRFTEVNARFGGGVPLAIAAGVPIAHWMVAMAAGLDVEIPPLGTYEVGLYLSRFDDSFFLTDKDRAHAARRCI